MLQHAHNEEAVTDTPLKRILLMLVLAMLSSGTAAGQAIVFVNHAATGANDGTTWADAFTYLQDALAVARAGDEVWVAAGVYRPDQGRDIVEGDSTASFHLADGVAMYGGFAGTEMHREERQWETNRTVLSGDLLGNDGGNVAVDEPTRSDNSLHVVTAKNVGVDTKIDGFAVTSGNAADGLGGGMVVETASLVIRKVVFSSNTAINGGGLFTQLGGRPLLDNVVFLNNEAGGITGNGGGLLNYGASLSLENVTFQSNRAKDGGGFFNDSDDTTLNRVWFIENHAIAGGGVYNMNADIRISNTLFLGNEASRGGGAMLNEKSSPLLANVVFSGNRVVDEPFGGGAMLNYESSPILINTVFGLNHAAGPGAVLWNEYKSYPTLINSIVWDNTAGGEAYIYNRSGACCPDGPSWIIVSHSLIQGGLPEGSEDRGGNIFTDPLFAHPVGSDGLPGTLDDDFHLESLSPAVDAGDNAALPADTFDLDDDGDRLEPLPVDLDGNVRIYDGGSGETTVDMGPFEFGAPPIGVAIETQGMAIPGTGNSELFPNPFSNEASLHIRLPQQEFITVTLYDLLGRRRDVLYQGLLGGANENIINLDGRHLPAGFYLVRIDGAHHHWAHSVIKSQ